MRVGDELGGHIVTGHIDGTAEIVSVTPEGESTRIVFQAPADLARFIAPKGSVALDGVSLTVNEVDGAPLWRQHHSAYVEGHDLRPRKAGRESESRSRSDGALCRPSGESVTMFRDYISNIEELIEDARNGRMFILVDAEDRENEGDLVIPAQMCTPQAVNFMAKYGRGLICLALTQERVAANCASR